MNNKRLGGSFEQELAEMLREKGFWVHLLTANRAGQPADIIAVKDDHAILIDCKVCSQGVFRTDRIETNQVGSMTVWGDAGCHDWWFALKMPDESIYMVLGKTAMTWLLDHTTAGIYWYQLKKTFLQFERWVERF